MVLFFFNDTATTEIYTLSLHDALPICLQRLIEHQERHGFSLWAVVERESAAVIGDAGLILLAHRGPEIDRKSTRLNSSHANISYAVFCLKKKKHSHPSHRFYLSCDTVH